MATNTKNSLKGKMYRFNIEKCPSSQYINEFVSDQINAQRKFGEGVIEGTEDM